MSWQKLEDANQTLAAFGRERLTNQVAYLATIRKDGSPRVHPVTPIVGSGRLFVFMEPTSPKGHDLQRDGRYALHAGVEDYSGGKGEFLVNGRASLITDPEIRAMAVAAANYNPAARYILFELDVASAFSTVYGEDGAPVRERWSQD